jgi:radical SAM protein with 4Fe4S-binding SPASM domain
MVVTMVTGGLGVTARLAARMAAAGVSGVSVSLDGTEAVHDAWRGVPGSYRAAVAAIGHLKAAGIEVAANTQINRASAPELDAIYDVARDAGVHAWQIQLTVPMGRAADRPELLLQPYELLDVFPRLAAIAERAAADGVRVHPGNNVGYFGPHEALLRGGGDGSAHWRGCQAGLQVLGLEADGSLKACPSLPSAPYVAGRLPADRLADLLDAPELAFNRRLLDRPAAVTEGLTGFCAGCYYAPVCRGGCNWTAHVLLGRRGDNPYCHHRALERQAAGLRERLVMVEAAPGAPFDHGRFELVVEPLPG